MRTKRIKASAVLIDDVLYGLGTVVSIVHLSRTEIDLYYSEDNDRVCNGVLPRNMDDLVEIVTHNSNKTGN